MIYFSLKTGSSQPQLQGTQAAVSINLRERQGQAVQGDCSRRDYVS